MLQNFFIVIFVSLCVTAYASQNRKVLLIGIDGCRSDALQQANTPNIDSLLGNSLYSFDSWHVGITWSGPSWTTILTGTEWNKHGVIGNSFAGSNFNTYPAFPMLAKEFKPNLKCVEVVEWSPLADDFYNDGWDKKIKVADGSTFLTADSAVIQLQDPDIDVLFAYFDQVDLTGHSTTFSPSNSLYINAIEDVDSAIGIVLNALYQRPDYANEDWLILLVTDHGGKSFSHGGNSFEERHTWWIANGTAVEPRQISEADPGTYNCHLIAIFDTSCVDQNLLKLSPVHADIAVTALHHLIFETGVHPETKPEWSLDGKSWLALPNAIAHTTDNPIKVIPNPAASLVSVTWEGNENVQILLTDLRGQVISQQQVFGERLDFSLEGVNAGCYLLHVQDENERIVKKLIVVK